MALAGPRPLAPIHRRSALGTGLRVAGLPLLVRLLVPAANADTAPAWASPRTSRTATTAAVSVWTSAPSPAALFSATVLSRSSSIFTGHRCCLLPLVHHLVLQRTHHLRNQVNRCWTSSLDRSPSVGDVSLANSVPLKPAAILAKLGNLVFLPGRVVNQNDSLFNHNEVIMIDRIIATPLISGPHLARGVATSLHESRPLDSPRGLAPHFLAALESRSRQDPSLLRRRTLSLLDRNRSLSSMLNPIFVVCSPTTGR